MHSLARAGFMLLGGGTFGAGLADVAHQVANAGPDGSPVGSGFLAGVGLAVLLVAALQRD